MPGKKKSLLILALLLAATAIAVTGFAYRSRHHGFAQVDTTRFMQMMKHKDFTLIDVHTPYQGEIPGTDEVLPYDRIADFANRLPRDKSAPIVVYCMGSSMGRVAAQTLVRMGYTHVTQYDDGMYGWHEAGGTLVYRPNGQ
ncbi:MAG TPA: rhodanese-like domain-containing protein [Desulfuromonadales bacterium]|nr:rhodanese-like domain-containing protein [Desulfuromonadales bacterium]